MDQGGIFVSMGNTTETSFRVENLQLQFAYVFRRGNGKLVEKNILNSMKRSQRKLTTETEWLEYDPASILGWPIFWSYVSFGTYKSTAQVNPEQPLESLGVSARVFVRIGRGL